MDHSIHSMGHAEHGAAHPSEQSHNKHEGHRTQDFLHKFWVVLVLTIPILVYSSLFDRLFTWTPPQFPGYQWVIFGLGSAIYFYGGWVFLVGAFKEIKDRMPGMMTLISLAITAAYSFSVFSVVFGEGDLLFWELATLIGVMLLGHWIEMRAVSGAQGALKELAKLLPDQAEVVRDGETKTIPLAELKPNDVVVVRPGAKVPADGTILEGRSELNESILTGESQPVTKSVGAPVIAGSMNGDGTLKVTITQIGEKTFLAGVMRLVAEAQASKSRLQLLSDRAAFVLTVIAVVSGVITFIVWILAGGGALFATERTVSVLVIACPHALGLAIPLVAAISTTMAARNGLLIRQRLALEAARTVSMVLFDKTGTLTKGEFGVDTAVPAEGETTQILLKFAAAVDALSEHPLAKAIVKHAQSEGVEFSEAQSVERIPGKGAKGVFEGKTVLVGNEALLTEAGVEMDAEHQATVKELSGQGKTVIHVVAGKSFLGSLALADQIRQESRTAIQDLKALGVKVAMVTGDSEDVAKWVAKELELDEYFARVLPEEKAERVKELQAKGMKVAMVGDGVNDAPALTQADLGIAVGAGTNVAIESAGIILVKSDPRDIPKIIRLSQLTYAKMIQNLFWATAYNIVALPIAAGALAYKGILLQPAVAAIFMSFSTVVVAVNATLLRTKKL